MGANELWQTLGLTHLKPQVASDWLTKNKRSKLCPKEAERVMVVNWTRGKHGSAIIVEPMAHIRDISEELHSGKQGTVHCRALQGLLFIRPLHS